MGLIIVAAENSRLWWHFHITVKILRYSTSTVLSKRAYLSWDTSFTMVHYMRTRLLPRKCPGGGDRLLPIEEVTCHRDTNLSNQGMLGDVSGLYQFIVFVVRSRLSD